MNRMHFFENELCNSCIRRTSLSLLYLAANLVSLAEWANISLAVLRFKYHYCNAS